MYNKKQIKVQMKRLMDAMDFSWSQIEKAEKKKSKNFKQFFNLYQLLGGLAWSYLCDQCEHEYKWNKRYKANKCKVCGQVERNK